ncbi:MAG: hypothetical protein KatS3mg095_0368 [Candidatus Parcubacteria bacterium]|nr:MAG: hypothetical protein KatS3mg095_0368 [Candidatus Parcubacteria bacterium]
MKYICPMGCIETQSEPGNCPVCGMRLVEVEEKNRKHHKEDDKHHGHKAEDFLKKFWLSFILTIFVILLSFDFLDLNIISLRSSVFSLLKSALFLIFSSIVFFYGGWVFLVGGYREIKAKNPGMMTLISLAITSAYIYSVLTFFFKVGNNFFWELTSLITIMLLGHYFEMKSVSSAQRALQEIEKLLPDTAELENGKIVSLNELRVGDIVVVRPGGKIPADGIVIEGGSEINESMITGESKPVLKEINSEVIAGTINSDGVLKIKVTKIGEETFLAGIKRLILEAQKSKSKLQALADVFAKYLTFIAIGVGSSSFVIWILLQKDLAFALERLVTVLVIACPHALGLAVPLVVAISTSLAVHNGFLIRNRLQLELARKVNVVLFDKTGTLTTGKFKVKEIIIAHADTRGKSNTRNNAESGYDYADIRGDIDTRNNAENYPRESALDNNPRQSAYVNKNMRNNAEKNNYLEDSDVRKKTLLYEDLTYKLRSIFFKVYEELGPYHKESVYLKAIENELKFYNISYDKEVSLPLIYKGEKISTYRVDLIVENKIIIELKSKPFLEKQDYKQALIYLKNSDYKLALIVNFGKKLKIKRIIHEELKNNIRVDPRDKYQRISASQEELKNSIRVNPRDKDPRLSAFQKDILQIAASLSQFSSHFISQGILERAKEENVEILKVEDFENLPGRGIKGKINDKVYFLGGDNLLKELNLLPPKIETIGTISYLVDENKNILGIIILEDEIRKEAKEAIYQLHKMGIKVVMVTGDKKEVAEKVARELGIDEYFAEVLPQEKVEIVKQVKPIFDNKTTQINADNKTTRNNAENYLRQSAFDNFRVYPRVNTTMFVGDGINDAPALMQADVGVAIGAGTNVAIESAGIILVRNDPRDIVKLIQLSKITYHKMIENLFWATGYNIFMIPLAAGVLEIFRMVFSLPSSEFTLLPGPAIAAIFMSLSTIIVSFNALRMRRI